MTSPRFSFRCHLEVELSASGVLAGQGEEALKQSSLAEEQVLFVLKQADAGRMRDGSKIATN